MCEGAQLHTQAPSGQLHLLSRDGIRSFIHSVNGVYGTPIVRQVSSDQNLSDTILEWWSY